jgi:hypothetical protein
MLLCTCRPLVLFLCGTRCPCCMMLDRGPGDDALAAATKRRLHLAALLLFIGGQLVVADRLGLDVARQLQLGLRVAVPSSSLLAWSSIESSAAWWRRLVALRGVSGSCARALCATIAADDHRSRHDARGAIGEPSSQKINCHFLPMTDDVRPRWWGTRKSVSNGASMVQFCSNGLRMGFAHSLRIHCAFIAHSSRIH